MSAIIANLREGRKHAFRLLSREHVLSLVDQAIVSGTSFLTTVSIASWSGSSELGIYAVGMSILISLLAFQDFLISQPYSIRTHYPDRAERAGASLTCGILFAAVSVLTLTIAAFGFLGWGAPPEMVEVVWALAEIVPFALTRDLARRFAFAQLEMGRALLLDLAVSAIQLFALVWLGASGRMTALNAYIVLGGACAFPTALWLYYSRAEFTIRVRNARDALMQSWELGKWLLAGRVTVQVQGSITYWISMAVAGAAVTGTYAACMSILGLANPLLIGLGNVMMPKSVVAWKNAGAEGLWHVAIENTVLIGALMAGFSLAVLIAGEPVMRLLFHGPEFEGLGHTLTVLALAMLAGAVGMPASNALAAMERPLWILAAGTVGAVLTVVLVWLLLEEWGLLGAAYGFLAGNIAGTVGRWIAFFLNIPKLVDTKHLMRALKDFTEVHGDSRWTITEIGEGKQAEVFAINSTGQRPIWRTYHTLVAKLYKPGAAFTLERAQAQFKSLTNLHAALDSRQINGWRISVPRPLHVCKSPLALVMTAVSGRHLDYYALKKETITAEMLRDAACAFAAALQQYWSSGQRHGDLTLDNVLFDDEAKQISFIDAEMIENYSCNSDTKRLTMASELATLLSGIVTDVMDTLGNQTESHFKRNLR